MNTEKIENWKKDIIQAKQKVRKFETLKNREKKYICQFLTDLEKFIIDKDGIVPKIEVEKDAEFKAIIDITLTDDGLNSTNISILGINSFEIYYIYQGLPRIYYEPEKLLFEEFVENYNYILGYMGN